MGDGARVAAAAECHQQKGDRLDENGAVLPGRRQRAERHPRFELDMNSRPSLDLAPATVPGPRNAQGEAA
jgi:hypothetical protein